MAGLRAAAAAFSVAAGLGLAGPAAADFDDLAGTAGYDERAALPARAVLEVQLLELGEGEGESRPIATVLVRAVGAQPYPFRLTYDEEMVRREGSYALAARIVLDGETVFQSAEAVPVFEGIGAGPAEIRMVRPLPDQPDEPGLEHSAWTVAEMPDATLAPETQAQLVFGAENAASGTGGCNSFEATYRQEPPQGLSFGGLDATLRGCSPRTAQQERLVFRALGRTRQYAVNEAGDLVLYDEDGETLLRLERLR